MTDCVERFRNFSVNNFASFYQSDQWEVASAKGAKVSEGVDGEDYQNGVSILNLEAELLIFCCSANICSI